MSSEYLERLRTAGEAAGSAVGDGAQLAKRMALRTIAGYAAQVAQLRAQLDPTKSVSEGASKGSTAGSLEAAEISAPGALTETTPDIAPSSATLSDAAVVPDLAPATETPEATADSEYGDPLANGLSKVGEVSYKDENFLPGSGNLTLAEINALVSGDDDISVANCSTFTTWMLASAGYDVKDTPDGALGNLQAYININAGLSTGSLAGDIAADSDNIKGAAAGFVATGIGVEVDSSEAKPGDFVQTWLSTGGGGHSTIIHRVHCTGAAIFGLSGSPTLVGAVTPLTGTAMGTDTPVSFIIDENTDPSLVGAHTVDKVEQLGAHLSGTNSEGETESAGVYTKKAKSLDDYNKAYLGRLNESPWANWTAADVAGWSPSPSDDLEGAPESEGAPSTPEIPTEAPMNEPQM